MKRILAASSAGIAVILAASTIMGGFFAWGIWAALGVVAVAIIAGLTKFFVERRKSRELPAILASFGFAFDPPRTWSLTIEQEKQLTDLAKAAFVLLLFDQTETGCWGKSYLPRHIAKGETLPLARGAITGTPFALIAISCYARRTNTEKGPFGEVERLVHESNNYAVFKTLDALLQPDGTFLRNYKAVFTGREKVPERSRHEAGACLIRQLYGKLVERDLRTIERLCAPSEDLLPYDFAVISRLFCQLYYEDSLPRPLHLKVARARQHMLDNLAHNIESAAAVDIVCKSDLRHDSINQWSSAWYLLPLLTLPIVPLSIRTLGTNRMHQFFSARSAAALTVSSLLPSEVGESRRGQGKSAFGTGIGLLSWRTLEQFGAEDDVCSRHAREMVDRLIQSKAEAIEGPMFNPRAETPEGYLGWGAICLGAASVGIRISRDECQAAITLRKEFDRVPVYGRSEAELASAYKHIIDRNKLLADELGLPVARAAARLAVIYEPVKQASEAIATPVP